MKTYFPKILFAPIVASVFFLSSCSSVQYTEKRSEALSQAVAATSDSIDVARIDLADKYSKEALRLAYPPKNRIVIQPITTKTGDTKSNPPVSTNNTPASNTSANNASTNNTLTGSASKNNPSNETMRLVIPEKLKHAKVLVEGSDEWNELAKQKEFAEKLKVENEKLLTLKNEVDQRLQKEFEIGNKMLQEINDLKMELSEKNSVILKKNIEITKKNLTIGGLFVAIGAMVYLRIKGIF